MTPLCAGGFNFIFLVCILSCKGALLVVAAWQENLPLWTAGSVCVLGKRGRVRWRLKGMRHREPWCKCMGSGRTCFNASLGSHGTRKRKRQRCVFSVPGLRQRRELPPSLPTSGVGGVQDVGSLDADNEVNEAGSSLLLFSRLLPCIYFQ